MNFAQRHALRSAFALFLNKPDDGAGAGGGTEPKTLAEATSALKSAQASLKDAEAAKSAAETAKATAETERDTARTEAGTQKSVADEALKEATKAKSELAAAQTQITTITGERDTAKSQLTNAGARITQLEGLCGVKGIDPNKAIDQQPAPSAGGSLEQLEADYAAAKTSAEKTAILEKMESLAAAKKPAAK